MEKLLRKFQGKKAPNPPKRDYTDKQGGERRTKSSMSDSEDELGGGGVFRMSNETSPRGSSPTPHGGTVERFRFSSQTSYGTGTVDLKSCGAGSGSQFGTNSRNVGGGEGLLDTRRRNDSGGGPKSPNTKTPIVLDDYSDPKDVLKAAMESGFIPPRTEGHNVSRPYAEDDYSVPYEMIKQMRSGLLPEDGPIPNQPYADDDYSLPYDIVKNLKKQPPPSKGKSSVRQHQHQYEEPPDTSEIPRRTSAGEIAEEHQFWEEINVTEEAASGATKDPQENGTALLSDPPLSPAPDQTPQNDMRPQGEYDNPWEWRSPALPRLPPESPGGEFKRSRSKSDVAHLGGINRTSPDSDTRPQDDYDQPWEWIQKNRQMSQVLTEKEKQSLVSRSGASTPDNLRRGSPRKLNTELKLELRHKHEVQGEKIDPNLSLDEQSFYHGKLSRLEAEKLLKPCKECSYLVRQSESAQKDYSLSLKSAKGFMHMKIVCNSQGYILGEFSKPFKGIPPMIHYYTTHKLNIRGAEHMALLHPVENQML
ncbi:SH2 domain-containing adapter protein F-like isoform X2 [Acanthaster planci]|uniref:SH2 domain-containing adapter protein F-like isoform X2 n=1 Tax=Acanthaster planci TaxID=133434 RepID=A0A8B7ZG74_ACAPL|nr:SH2 domain-containing adapter protein F-like isoform X2 [Acanthaster planci]